MARKRTKRTSKKDSPGLLARLLADSDPELWKRFARRSCRLLVLVMVLAGVVVGLRYLDGYVHRISSERDMRLVVEFPNYPKWASEELIEYICLSSGVNGDDLLLDKELVAKWAGNLARNPWVRQVRKVHRNYNGRVVIDCELRRPVAAMREGPRLYYIDLEGVVLPSMLVDEHLVELRGEPTRLPQPGECVSSSSLMAGLGVLAMIREVDEQMPRQERIWRKLARLDVSNYEGRINRANSHLSLYTQADTEIRWGAAVGRERPFYEAPAKYKLASLYRAFKKFGSLDKYQSVELRNLRKEKADPLREG